MENTWERVCPNCGEKLFGGALFCAKCGAKVGENSSGTGYVSKTPNFFQKNKKIILGGVIAVAAVVAILFIVNAVQAANLKKELKRDWSRVEGEKGSYILCILDFSDDEITYRVETSYAWMNTTLATFDYKVVSGNKIKVSRYGDEWKTITVKFNDDKTVMTVSPALTSVDKIEIWLNAD